MHGDVVLLGCASKREGMILPDRDLRAAQEDVLYLLAIFSNMRMWMNIPDQLASWCAPS